MISRTSTVYRGTEIISQTVREVSWQEVRATRNSALKDSDWRAGKDVVLSTAWKEYRQALRDLPQVHATANEAAENWPVMVDE